MERMNKLRKALKRWDQGIYDGGEWDDLVNAAYYSTSTEKNGWATHPCFPWLTSRLKYKAKAEWIEHISLLCRETGTYDGLVICRRFYPKYPETQDKGKLFPANYYNIRYYIHEVGECPQCDYQ